MSRTLTWEEIDKDWKDVQARCSAYEENEKAAAIARYCIGHSLREVAGRLGVHRRTVTRWLEHHAMANAIGGGAQCASPFGGTTRSIEKITDQFGPTEEDQHGEEFATYVEHYQAQGHAEDAAKTMAKAEWAAEAAVEAGVIQESMNKRNEKVNQILFPSDSKDSFEIDLKMHMARVESAASFLDQAKINHLRRKATCERVAAAHEKWLEQVERILNFQPTLNKD